MKTTVLEDKLFKMLKDNLADLWQDDLISEAGKSLRNSNPCWKGYHPVGTKKKGEGGLGQVAGIGINGKQFNFSIKDLIAKAQNYPVKKLNPQLFVKQLADRHEDPKQTAARAQSADLQYPIIVVQDGNTLMIADGTHRAQKAIMNKLPAINAHVIPVKDMAEFSKQGVAEGTRYTGNGIHPKLVEILKQRGYKGPYQLGKLKKWFVHLKDDVNAQATDEIMVTGNDVEYDEWVLKEQYGEYSFGSEGGYMTGDANRVIKNTAPMLEQGMAEGSLEEKWTQKYKSSINCSHPKGFSQKAHCAGKKKK